MNMNFGVCVRCFTYNHAPYIIDTFKGFVLQNTSFPFIVMVVDDASTDGEQEVISKYINEEFDINASEAFHRETDDFTLDFVQHKQNSNCFFAVYYLKYNHYRKKSKLAYLQEWRSKSEFEAICEGDDYWTDPLKLQKQVDFLDSHPDYSFCCHRFNIYEQNTNKWLKEYAYNYYLDGKDLEITPELYSSVWVTQPLTCIARIASLRMIQKDLQKYKYSRDVHLFYYLLKVGKGISLNRSMGVYRWHDGGIASSKKGLERYLIDYNINKELYYKTKDSIFRHRYVYHAIHMLRFMRFSPDSLAVIREIWCISSFKNKIDIILSLIIPLPALKIMTKYFAKKHVAGIQLN